MESFEKVAEQYRPMISHLIRKLGIYKNCEEFEQIGLIALWEAYEHYQPQKGSFTSYAYVTIKGNLLKALAKDKRVEETMVYPKEEFWLNENDPSLKTPLELETLLTYCEMLTENEKKWVIATFYHQLKLGEIASREHKSVNAVKGWRSRALQKLKQQLKKGCPS